MPRQAGSGRKRKPAALLELHGTVNVTRHADRLQHEPQAPAGDMTVPPDYFADDEREIWAYNMKWAPRAVLKPADRAMMIAFTEAEAMHRRAHMAQKKIERENPKMPPLLMMAKTGFVPSPYISIMRKAAIQMARAASELGFTPTSRARLIADRPLDDDKPAANPWQQLKVLQGGKAT